MMTRRFALTVLLLAGCATTVRFEDTPIVWHADDARDVPQPAPRKFGHIGYFTDILVLRRLPRALELRDLEPAHNTNALDEVPNSTWFTNRIGIRDMSPREAARGPMLDGRPRLPLVITGGKTGGRNPGFVVKDARGARFVIKFDRVENPGMQTGTSVLVNRIFWTLGYNVPQDTLVHFRRADLQIAADARIQPVVGRERRMTVDDLEDVLATAPLPQRGRYRASASRLLHGTPLGGAPAEGVRRDDENDMVPHEHRRELRGLRVFAAWLSHVDIKEDNFLDMFVEEDGRRFVRHYMIDFGEALGAHRAETAREESGSEFIVDWEKNGLALLALGLWPRRWEREKPTPWPEVGTFSAVPFDPAAWREQSPYWPFFAMDPADAYWAAKIVMRFDRELLTAVVAEAELPPEPSAYLVATLLERARKIGHVYLESVTALDAFHVDGANLCAYDLGVFYRLARGGVVERLGRGRRVIAKYSIGVDGRVCLPLPRPEGYSIARLRTRRSDGTRPVMQVHFVGGARPRVLGIVRSEAGPCIEGRGLPKCR